MRVLIVEDDPLQALASGLVLAEAGHHIVGVESRGKAAVACISGMAVDLVLTDLQLGDQTGGAEVAREAKTRCGTAALLLCADPKLARRAQRWALGWLRKPYTPQDLVDAVSACERTMRDGRRAAAPDALELF